MNDVPTVAYDVVCIRKAGWPTGGDAYGHGVLMVVDGVTPIQGDGNAVRRAKQDRPISLLRILTYAKCGK
jgi:hypothetical protein